MTKWNDYGESSLTLLAVHCGMDKEVPAVPADPSDFERCMQLFECLGFDAPQIFDLLRKASDNYPIWQPFEDKWDTLMEFYGEEVDKAKAPKLYKLIQELHFVEVGGKNDTR